MSSEVQEGWHTVELGDIAKLSMGETLLSKNLTGSGIPVFSANTDDGPWGFTSNNRRRLQRGDIVVGARGSIGFPRRPDFDAFTCTQTTIAVEPDREVVDSEYLHHALCATDILGIASQQAVPMLTIGSLSPLEVALPPLDEQRRIAEVMRSVDEAIAANQDTLGQVGRARSAILHTAFEETPWEAVPLGELGTWQSGGTPSKADDGLWGGDVPWVCPRDMKTPVIRQTHSTLTPLALGGSCKLAPKGTLMIVVRGMILAKAIPTATTAMDATFNQDIKAFRPNGRALPKFVQLCLQHQERQLLRVVNTATHGTKKLDTDTLLAVSVPLPDLETQQELADAVSDLDFASVKYGEEHIRLSTIKHALMSDLLSGRVRVPA
ncbi:MAG: hypothetical protein CMN65_03685 [Sphingomonadaceae bacterium]|nr:hypothetical protein [Sphingomonadaceae bacterium]|tara:strand:- start:73 stop:1209 length:1137 start_codon:yes stop_codon:yes gene_type:complete